MSGWRTEEVEGKVESGEEEEGTDERKERDDDHPESSYHSSARY